MRQFLGIAACIWVMGCRLAPNNPVQDKVRIMTEDEDLESFRAEVRAFLDAELPPEKRFAETALPIAARN